MSICIDLCMSRLQSQIVRHDNRIETTVYCLYVGVVRLGNFTSLLGLVECHFCLIIFQMNTPNLMLDILFSTGP